MNLEELNHVAINCKTRESAVALMIYLNSMGITWVSGESLTGVDNLWHRYRENMAYSIERKCLYYAEISYYVRNNYHIIDALSVIPEEAKPLPTISPEEMYESLTKVTWHDVLHAENTMIGHIDRMGTLADELRYPFILWNDRIWARNKDRWEPTSLTKKDII